ncbi:pentatricopeptide repeat-containing protein At1g31920 [Impatiens glandulifera]|uniref:pentatricopeptide repeat-containing protein At1g31920 n=1 Tax=Impatiens glandulifera TaxID=253017 RepID=UPI001FB1872F|nr:pentatricopeptide repeat-containing protein At1g31920 [Impatiens glandulifera]
MIGTSVLRQTHVLMLQDDHFQNLECNHSFKEQEFISVLKNCNSIAEIKQIHAQVIKLDLIWNSLYANNLVVTCALSDWGSMDYACSIFQQIDDPDSYVFNSLIRGHVKNMNPEDALYVFDEMLERGVVPDNFTFPILLKACTNLRAIKEGNQIHALIFKLGLDHDVYIQNSLINMYGKCKEIQHSYAVFHNMEERTLSSWSALISSHSGLGMFSDCLDLFRGMNEDGCRKTDESLLVSVISACTHLGFLDLGRSLHAYLLRNFSKLNVAVETSLVDLYVKCGSIEKGLSLFDRMNVKNQLSYSVMISGFGLYGGFHEAHKLFVEMIELGLQPDHVVYVGLLSSCAHAGSVELGLEFFDRMRLEHGIEPTVQHYGCMVDLLGRAGKVKEAFALIEGMSMEPNDVVWRSLLTSCRLHNELRLGEIAAKRILLLNVGDFTMLSDLYARNGMWDDVAAVRKEIVEMGLSRNLGKCTVEMKRRVYAFVSQDRSHSDSSRIYEMIHQMEWQLRFERYCPDLSQVLFDVDDEEKRQLLSGHSQKLAIAFALLNNSGSRVIRIVRNVRMCGDCHAYTKLVSMIYEKEIVVKDRNVFHRFRDGRCSCRDYW